VVNANEKQMKVKWEKSYNENDYHTRNLTLTLKCIEKPDITLLLLPYVIHRNPKNVVLDA
jgi:hypothetical protein